MPDQRCRPLSASGKTLISREEEYRAGSLRAATVIPVTWLLATVVAEARTIIPYLEI
jgi:hypothetical protein